MMTRDSELHAQASLGAHLRSETDKWHQRNGSTLTFRTQSIDPGSADMRNAHREEQLIEEIVPKLPGMPAHEARAFLRTMRPKDLQIMAAQLRTSLRVNSRLNAHDRDMALGSTFVANARLQRNQDAGNSGLRTLRVNHDESGDAAAWRRRQEHAEALQVQAARDSASMAGNPVDAMTPSSSFVVNEQLSKRGAR